MMHGREKRTQSGRRPSPLQLFLAAGVERKKKKRLFGLGDGGHGPPEAFIGLYWFNTPPPTFSSRSPTSFLHQDMTEMHKKNGALLLRDHLF